MSLPDSPASTLLVHDDRAVIEVTGPDAVSFLQGVFTNDVTKLSDQGIQYNLMLTPQGRFHFEAIAHDYGEDIIYLDTPKVFAEQFHKRLRIYKLRADVSISLLDSVKVVTVDVPCDSHAKLKLDPRNPNLGYRGLLFTDDHEFEHNTVLFKEKCLKLCIPEAGHELIPEKTIPLEANMEELNALCFDKGCYLGQELTTRTKHQGLVRKKLFAVEAQSWDTSQQDIETPIDLYVGDTKAGQLLSFKNGYGIAKLRIEHVQNNPTLSSKDPSHTFTLTP